MEEEQPKPAVELQPAASKPEPRPLKSALGRLSRAACLGIDADTAEMMAACTPIIGVGTKLGTITKKRLESNSSNRRNSNEI